MNERPILQLQYLNQRGQTAVEYILLLLMMTSIIVSLTAYMKNKYLGDPTKCQSAAQQQLLLCRIDSFVNPSGGAKKFQYYPFKK